MDFSSDTSAPAHPAVLEALVSANRGSAASYGADAITRSVTQTLRDLFETDLDAWITASGTAANALALSLMCPPTASILCHEMAHIAVDERGAPEFYTGGGKLHLLPGEHGKVDLEALRTVLARRNPDFVHETPAEVLSLTNLTESGTAYTIDQIAERSELAHGHGLSVHLDGARLANALVSQKANPADATWRAGVDVLTLGLTKTGAMGCEIIILFGGMRARCGELQARAKRAGQMPPKMRFLAAQASALLDEALWLDLAGRANAAAARLGRIISAAPGASLRHAVEGNEVFADLPPQAVVKLCEAGAQFYPWPDGSQRLVCSWCTSDAELDAVQATLSDVQAG